MEVGVWGWLSDGAEGFRKGRKMPEATVLLPRAGTQEAICPSAHGCPCQPGKTVLFLSSSSTFPWTCVLSQVMGSACSQIRRLP